MEYTDKATPEKSIEHSLDPKLLNQRFLKVSMKKIIKFVMNCKEQMEK